MCYRGIRFHYLLSLLYLFRIGQDPYHEKGQAMGLCFSVPRGIAVPSSLKNIYKELAKDIAGFQVPAHGDLESWASQAYPYHVLLDFSIPSFLYCCFVPAD